MEAKFPIPTQELDINQYLEIDNLKKFSDFNFEKDDFDDFPTALEKAENFWKYKNRKRSSSKPYTYLKDPADYAAVIFMKNNDDYDTFNSLSDKREYFIEQSKLFVKTLIEERSYEPDELFNCPSSSSINTFKFQEEIEDILE